MVVVVVAVAAALAARIQRKKSQFPASILPKLMKVLVMSSFSFIQISDSRVPHTSL